MYKNAPEEGQVDILDGRVFQTEGASLRAFHCPGHTSDHMALVLDEENAMFTGDNVLGHGTAVFEDLPTYLSSLDRMQRQFDGRAYPGHGAVIEDGGGKIVEYIRHRQQREDEVMQVLKSGTTTMPTTTTGAAVGSPDCDGAPAVWTSTEIVKVIYKAVTNYVLPKPLSYPNF